MPQEQLLKEPPNIKSMNYQELLKKTEDFVNLFYTEHPDPALLYHNQKHTAEVLDNTKRIADHFQLDDRLFFIVSASACLHDTGHLIKSDETHELKSVELAQTFLKSIGVNEEDIAEIKKCILATAMPQKPETLAEKIMCDADLYNLGTNTFREKNKLMRKEMEAINSNKIDGITWRASSISLLENHHYHTQYCQLLLDKTKAENLSDLKNKQQEKLAKVKSTEGLAVGDEEKLLSNSNAPAVAKPPKIKKKDRPVKGVETMFRLSSSNNIRISVMADNKAHIMISVNSIIISVVLGLIIKNLDEHKNLIIPTMILLGVNVCAIIYSVLATRPKVAGGVFTKEQVEDKSVNLLFFGSFYKMNFKEYDEGIKAMMTDKDFLYGTLTKDIFWQGKVLGRKYKLLRTSYTIFLYGIIAAVIAYAVATIFF